MSVFFNSVVSHPIPPLSVYSLVVYARFEQAAALDAFKGSTFHGGFGQALQRVSPTGYQQVFAPTNQPGQGVPRPYVLVPPLTTQQQFQGGDELQFRVSLFGQACEFLGDVIEALLLWQGLGLGGQRAKFAIQQIELCLPNHAKLCIYRHSHEAFAVCAAPTLDEWITATAMAYQPLCAEGFAKDIAGNAHYLASSGFGCGFAVPLRSETLLMLKAQGQPLRCAPSAEVLLRTIKRRLHLLCRWSADDLPLTTLDNTDVAQLAQHITLADDTTQPSTWQRFSERKHVKQPMQGIQGSWQYHFSTYSALAAFIPWLVAAEQLGLGNKTSFGLGQITWGVSAL